VGALQEVSEILSDVTPASSSAIRESDLPETQTIECPASWTGMTRAVLIVRSHTGKRATAHHVITTLSNLSPRSIHSITSMISREPLVMEPQCSEEFTVSEASDVASNGAESPQSSNPRKLGTDLF
jgi:hypothetical protein